MSVERDRILGAALAELDVPEHRLTFDAELAWRLSGEHELQAPRPARRRLAWGLRAAAVAAAVSLIVLVAGLAEDDRVPDVARTEVASAAEVKAAVRAGLARARTMAGVVVSDGPQADDVNRWRFVLSADGDFRLVGLTLPDKLAYDASSGIERSLNSSASAGGPAAFAVERRGLAPGPPDPAPATWLLPRDLGAVVRALLAADDARVREISYEGRPAWRLAIDVTPNAIVPDFSGDRLELTVDRATGVPVRVVETRRGSFVRELRIEELAVDQPVAARAFALDFPGGAEVARSDDGFRRVRLGGVRGAAGYAPLVPGWLPRGFELTEVAVAPGTGTPTGVEGGNPASEDVVSLSYRRGFDQLLVTTRRSGPDPARWSDPLATGEGFVDDPETVVLGAGALADARAELLVAPRSTPHLWTVAAGLVVTVNGDLTRADLVRVAESLAPLR